MHDVWIRNSLCIFLEKYAIISNNDAMLWRPRLKDRLTVFLYSTIRVWNQTWPLTLLCPRWLQAMPALRFPSDDCSTQQSYIACRVLQFVAGEAGICSGDLGPRAMCSLLIWTDTPVSGYLGYIYIYICLPSPLSFSFLPSFFSVCVMRVYAFL